jgi:hypothetical protein
MATSSVYPMARADRGVPSSFTPLPEVSTASAAPQTKVIAFRIANTVAPGRETRSFGPFVGPAILKYMRLEINANVAGGTATFGVGVASAPVTENGVALATVKGWRELIDQVQRDGTVVPSTNTGFMQTESPATPLVHGGDMNIIIPDRNFFLVFTAYCSGAGFRWIGHASIIDGVSETALANFL